MSLIMHARGEESSEGSELDLSGVEGLKEERMRELEAKGLREEEKNEGGRTFGFLECVSIT